MFSRLKKLLGLDPRTRYRVTQVGSMYVAEYKDYGGWVGIRQDGTAGLDHTSLQKFMHVYGVGTEEVAAARINRHHAINYGEEVIWEK